MNLPPRPDLYYEPCDHDICPLCTDEVAIAEACCACMIEQDVKEDKNES